MSEHSDEKQVVPPRWLETTFREGVRKRPAMFVGGTDARGLHEVVNQILMSALVSGLSRSIAVTLRKDGSLSIADDGRGFSMLLEDCLTNPPCPDFSKGLPGWNDPARDVSDFAIANALSERFWIEADVAGKVFQQEYRGGAPVGPAVEIPDKPASGISATFSPDPEIFADATFSSMTLRGRLEELASLHSGASIWYTDEAADKREQFHYADGIRSFVERLNQSRTPLHDIVVMRDDIDVIQFEVGIQFCEECDEVIRAYANDWYCCDWGTHVTGVRSGLTRSVKRAARKTQLKKWSTKNNGLTAVVSVQMESPLFMGSTKSKLGNPEVQNLLAVKVGEQMFEFFVANPDALEAIIRTRDA